MFYTSYFDAYDAALAKAREMNRPVGLEACKEYGKSGFRVKLIPVDPDKRFGWEMRCEVVKPTDPVIPRRLLSQEGA